MIGKFKNEECVILENEFLRAVILPFFGGKTVSVYDKKNDFELLFQNKNEKYISQPFDSDFSKYDASGFDDAFPNLDGGIFEGVRYPDHGEIRSLEMICSHIDNNSVSMQTNSSRFGYTYEKNISLNGRTLCYRYKIQNNSDKTLPCFWTMHCLMRCEEDMEILLPDDAVINALDSELLGAEGTKHKFPLTDDGINIGHIFDSAGKYEKFYADGAVNTGECRARYNRSHEQLMVRWDKEVLPYLGFWITKGGYRGDYNCAFEPSSGYYDSMERAEKNKTLWYLAKNEIKSFDINLTLESV